MLRGAQQSRRLILFLSLRVTTIEWWHMRIARRMSSSQQNPLPRREVDKIKIEQKINAYALLRQPQKYCLNQK
jgi:hypothetical protein